MLNAQVEEFTLGNGMRVVNMHDPTSPVTKCMMWYGVGSRDESSAHLGVSHFLEHMMFKGTAQYPYGFLDDFTHRRGGKAGAFTSFDFTAYYETLPATDLDLALQIEADRMVELQFNADTVATEKDIILQERRTLESDPKFLLQEAVVAAAYNYTPGFSRFIIGQPSDIRSLGVTDLKNYYQQHYQPNRAVLVVAGQTSGSSLRLMAEHRFGKIPGHKQPAPVRRLCPLPSEVQRIDVPAPGLIQHVSFGWRTAPGQNLMDLQLLQAILAGARGMHVWGDAEITLSARLHRLVEAGLVHRGYSMLLTPDDGGLFLLTLELHEGVNPHEVEQEVLAEVDRLRSGAITDEEVERAAKLIRSQYILALDSTWTQARCLGKTLIQEGSTQTWTQFLDRLSQVDVRLVVQTAQSSLTRDSLVMGLSAVQTQKASIITKSAQVLPKEQAQGAVAPNQAPVARSQNRYAVSGPVADAKIVPTAHGILGHRRLENGLQVLVHSAQSHRTALIRLYLPAGSQYDAKERSGLASLVAHLLPRRVSAGLDKLGAILRVDPQVDSISVELQCMAEDLRECLVILAEAVCTVDADERMVAVETRRLLGIIQSSMSDAGYVANRTLHGLVYPVGHPYRHPVIGEESTVSTLSPVDVMAFQQRYYVPAESICTVVCGLDPQTVLQWVEDAFGGWRGRAAGPPVDVPKLQRPQFRQVHVPGAEPATAEIMIGWALVSQDHPDYIPLRLLSSIMGDRDTLGVGRLFRVVRENHGYAYSQYSSFVPRRGPSLWTMQVTAHVSQTGAVVDLLMDLVRGLHTRPTRSEFNSILSSHRRRLESRGASAPVLAQLLEASVLSGAGGDLEEYTRQATRVTALDLERAALDHLRLDSVTVVLASSHEVATHN